MWYVLFCHELPDILPEFEPVKIPEVYYCSVHKADDLFKLSHFLKALKLELRGVLEIYIYLISCVKTCDQTLP